MRFPGKRIGYVRTARWFKSIREQEKILVPFECWNTYIEENSGADVMLHLALMDCRAGDMMLLDLDAYFATPHRNRRQMFRRLIESGAGFQIVGTAIDSNGPQGEHVIAALLAGLEYQHREHSQIVKLGIERAKAAGVLVGRPSALDDTMRGRVQLLIDQGFSMRDAAVIMGVGRSTLYDAGLRTKRKGRPKKDRPKVA